MDLTAAPTTIRVSSTLNRDVRQWGKKHLIDGSDETCWNSDQGSPQFIFLDFNRPVKPEKIRLMFQGGFCGKQCTISGTLADVASPEPDGSAVVKIGELWPADDNSLQEFDVSCDAQITQLKIVFDSSTDFYGRITVYKLELTGVD